MAGGGVSEDGDIGFQIAPMVDVVFVLLLFFMAAAGSQKLTGELTTKLPGGHPTSLRPLTTIPIDILPDGRISVNNRIFDSASSRSLPELREWLEETIARFGDRDPVIIRPDPNTQHQRVIDVLDAVSASGVTKLTFG
jgi:biopolymer transport protein ExbD